MLVHLLAAIGPEWLYHPLGVCVGHHSEVVKCRGYNWWSGIASDFGQVTLITGLVFGAWRYKKQHECHVESPENCHRFGRPVPGTGHVACRLHHPHAADRNTGITAEDILKHHDESEA